MFFGSEMRDNAVWRDYADAFRTAMMIRSKMAVIVAPVQEWDATARAFGAWKTVGYGLVLIDPNNPSKNSVVTKGLVHALMQRHDAFEEREVDGKRVTVQIAPVPGIEALPFYTAMPKEAPQVSAAR